MSHVPKMPEKRCTKHQSASLNYIETPGARFAKWVCSDCNKWVQHAPNPKSSDEMLQRQEMIFLMLRKLFKIAKTMLCDNDIEFLMTIYSVVNLNLVQQEKYLKLVSFVESFKF